MPNKTAMQEIMDIVEIDYSNGVEISMKVLYKMLSKGLIKEKQQIKNAFNQGYRDGETDSLSMANEEDVSSFENAENYFKEKFPNISVNDLPI